MLKFLMGIALGIGITGVSFSLYLSWNGLTITPRQPITPVVVTPVNDDEEDSDVTTDEEDGEPELLDEPGGDNDDEEPEEDPSNEIAELVAISEPAMVFIIGYGDSEKERFTKLEDVEAKFTL